MMRMTRSVSRITRLLLLCLSLVSPIVSDSPTGIVSFLGGSDNRELEVQVSGDQIASYIKTLQTVPDSVYKDAAIITHMEEGQGPDYFDQMPSNHRDKMIPATRMESEDTSSSDGYPYFMPQPFSNSKYESDYDPLPPAFGQDRNQPNNFHDDEPMYKDLVPPPQLPPKNRNKPRKNDNKSRQNQHYRDNSYSQNSAPKEGKYGYKNNDPMGIRTMREILLNLMKQVETLQAKSEGNFSPRRDRDFRSLPTDYLDLPRSTPFRPSFRPDSPVPSSPFPSSDGGLSAFRQDLSVDPKPRQVYLKTSDLIKLLTSASEPFPRKTRSPYGMHMPLGSVPMPMKMYPPMFPFAPYGGGYYTGLYPMMSGLIPHSFSALPKGEKPCPFT